ncbi:MBOAT family O-acyltransferase [Maribacter halichondriae]|uniref:MBOAT family O-acyltransferase n=1 Tax=Maribacter halichondriae TaxID=2980554 RepID=UPI003D31CAD3
MLFNSLDFAIFLPIVFAIYWALQKSGIKLQNLLVVVASYIFYGWWDWHFLLLIFFSTLIDYSIGQKLSAEEMPKKRKILLWCSISVNLGVLGFFKYYNFFLDNFITAFSFFGADISASSLHIILPVGISFYTFQTLSYTIDVYRRKLEPTNDFIAFAAFVSFFPQLVAGPIERASQFLPQFSKKRKFEYDKAVDGMRQILWGLFKKMIIADNCAIYANHIFENSAEMNGSSLFLGALFFTFQIYGDFSGYSDIAIGVSRLFGFDLMRNFAFPYFSRDISEFWRRWHISLSTWFKDYLYIPLGGSRNGMLISVRNVLIVFIVSGFWHGANWTFIAWGALHAFYIIPFVILRKNRVHLHIVAKGNVFPSIREILQMVTTFGLVVLAWIFFRAENVGHAIQYLSAMLSPSFIAPPPIHQFGQNVVRKPHYLASHSYFISHRMAW